MASRMGAPGTWTKADTPFPWDPKAAITLFDAANLIDVYLDPSIPMTRELMLLIFFHETGFANIRQRVETTKTNPQGLGPGVGFGQMEVLNSDKPEFFRGVMGITPSEALFDTVTGDEHFAIRAHCAYFAEKFRRGASTKGALMAAQAGGKTINQKLIAKLMAPEAQLAASITGSDRGAIIDALNACRWYIKRDAKGKPIMLADGTPDLSFQPIPLSRFPKYWDFTVPTSELMFGLRK